MESPSQLFVFILDDQRYGLELSAVERVVPAVAIIPLPGAPHIILGVINVHGRIVPVAHTRRRFRLPEREIRLSDRFVIARASRRPVALLVDRVTSIVDYSSPERIVAEAILPHLSYVKGVVKLKDGMILIHDLDEFLSLEEAQALNEAMEHA